MRVSGKHNDLDNVGPSLRHHTFFEMLGNFSFGDYFKQEAIPFAWELLTTVWQLPADRLYPTIFKGEAGIPRDDEAHGIWTALVPAERITELGLAENFWAMGDTGPCGRCSEIHYYRGDDYPCDEERQGRPCRGLECSCDRFVEIWNNVFMEFDRQADGTLKPLPAPSIDTGMGLERITAVIQGKLSNYDTDLFTPILDRDRRARRPRLRRQPGRSRRRVDAGHRRPPARDDLPDRRRRRAVERVARLRAAQDHAARDAPRQEARLHRAGPARARRRGRRPRWATPTRSCARNRDAIVRVVRSEEERFDAVLTAGLPRLEEVLDRAAAAGTRDARRRGVPALRLARRAARLHGGPGQPAADRASIARASTGRWRASA